MEKQKKIDCGIIIVSIGIGLVLELVEWLASFAGLELRTFAQIVKGSLLWLVLPCAIVTAVYDLLKGKIKNWQRTTLMVLAVFLLIGAASLRGMFYLFTRQMVEEELMEDGVIEGKWSDFLQETSYSYYVPVAGIFRKPFPGWTLEQLEVKLKDTYGIENAEYVSDLGDGWYRFRIPDKLEEGAYLEFRAHNNYLVACEAYETIFQSELNHFWENRGRDASGVHSLSINCSDNAEDMEACAVDLTDWLQFVKDTGELPYENAEAAKLLNSVQLQSGTSSLYLSLYPLSTFMEEGTWSEHYEEILSRIQSAFGDQTQQQETQSQRPSEMKEEIENDFMAVYQGDYEKECLVGDGTIRYRMVIEDAAAGSRFYGLLKSTDGGETWQMQSSDPFQQSTGMGIDFTFLDENFGFATLGHNGGAEADLYVTENGGISYQQVIMQGYTVSLSDGYTYDPYDYPQMPYEEDGVLYVQCGQGNDGDYDGGDEAGTALYQSVDGGHIFTFVKILANPEK
jgi:hypothetical protein